MSKFTPKQIAYLEEVFEFLDATPAPAIAITNVEPIIYGHVDENRHRRVPERDLILWIH
jgi:hypothetical protein